MPAVYHDDYDGLGPARMARHGTRIERVPWDRRKLLLDHANVRAFLTPGVVAAPELARLVRRRRQRRTRRRASPARGTRPLPRRARGDAGRRQLRHRPISVQSRLNSAMSYAVDEPCNGYLVFAENHNHGWSATIDGWPARLLRADYAFTGRRLLVAVT